MEELVICVGGFVVWDSSSARLMRRRNFAQKKDEDRRTVRGKVKVIDDGQDSKHK